MASQDTLDTAVSWYRTGVEKVESHSFSIGLSYLEKAIPVFEEAGDRNLATQARHYRLLALKLSQRHEEVEREFARIMEGYNELGNHYGKALLIVHLAESLGERGRWERANSYFNLAAVIAENFQFAELMVHIFLEQAKVSSKRDNHLHAIRCLKRAEHFSQGPQDTLALANLKHLRGGELSSMGEVSEAAAHLEEAQSLYLKEGRPREALKPLNLLKKIYGSGEMAAEQERVSALSHQCAQVMLKRDSFPIDRTGLGPPIEPPHDPVGQGAAQGPAQ
ncbi:MAG: hypothetical protein V3S64_15980 [bacterium]